MLARPARLRLSGHGGGLRLRYVGSRQHDPLDRMRECCRASLAVDKALGESVREAISTGASWQEVGRALGVHQDAQSRQDVLDAFAEIKRAVWNRFWE